MVCDVMEIASGVGLVRARRDGVGAVVAAPVAAAVPGVAVSMVLASAGSVWLVPVDVAVLSSAESAVAFVLVPSAALSVPLLVASACACCSVVSWG